MARKAIFITGGGSGIGRAIAVRFAAGGWSVGLGDIDAGGMRDTLALLPPGVGSTHLLDVRDRAAWDEALAAFAKEAGRIDALANNAGVPLGGPLAALTQGEIDRTLDINLRGCIYGAQAAHPYLTASAPGSALVFTASAAGIYGGGGMTIYGASKAGVRSLTESLDAEWHGDGIVVRSICPGFIDTPLVHRAAYAGTNVSIRDRVVEAGLEFTPVEDVAQAAWDAVHGAGKPHVAIGKTARRLTFAARWMPGLLRRRSRKMAAAAE